MNTVQVRIMRLAHAADLPLPAYQSELAAGLDLTAAVPADAPVMKLDRGTTLPQNHASRMASVVSSRLSSSANCGCVRGSSQRKK